MQPPGLYKGEVGDQRNGRECDGEKEEWQWCPGTMPQGCRQPLGARKAAESLNPTLSLTQPCPLSEATAPRWTCRSLSAASLYWESTHNELTISKGNVLSTLMRKGKVEMNSCLGIRDPVAWESSWNQQRWNLLEVSTLTVFSPALGFSCPGLDHLFWSECIFLLEKRRKMREGQF